MFCRKCGTSNEEGAKFCQKCGAPMMRPSGNGRISGSSVPVNQRKRKKNTGKVILFLILIFLLIAAAATAVVIGLKKKKEKEFRTETRRAEKYLEELDYEKAEDALLAAIEIDAKQPEPYIELADIYQKQNRPVKAKSILKKGMETTRDKKVGKEYSYYEFADETLAEKLDESETGTIELSYKKMNEYMAAVEAAEDVEGLANYRIMDFDGDGEKEVLALVIKRESTGMNERNALYLEMYERTEDGFQKQAEFRPAGNVLGVNDRESDGVFLKIHEGTPYICGGLLSTIYLQADGSTFTVFVLTYDGKDFVYEAGFKDGITGSSFEYVEESAKNTLMEKLDAIGLPKAAAHIRDNYMMNLIYEDDVDAVLFRVEGENSGGDGSRYNDSRNTADLGKVVLKYWKDSVEPENH